MLNLLAGHTCQGLLHHKSDTPGVLPEGIPTAIINGAILLNFDKIRASMCLLWLELTFLYQSR